VERGQLWTEGLLNIVPSSVLSVQILANNIVVSLFAYCAGFLFGLGTLYILGLKRLDAGRGVRVVSRHGLGQQLLSFMVAHGCVRALGHVSVGRRRSRGGRGTHPSRAGRAHRIVSRRSAALRQAPDRLRAAVGGSGILEGYVSPDPRVPPWARGAIGAVYWLFMVALLSGWLFGRRAGPAAAFEP